MGGMFRDATSFNQNIGSWDTSLVDDMGGMFRNARLFAGDLSNWDTSSLRNLRNTFWGAAAFNSDIGNWTTSQIVDMANLFKGASVFNQDLSNWDTSSVLNSGSMFEGAEAYNATRSPLALTGPSSSTFISEFDLTIDGSGSFQELRFSAIFNSGFSNGDVNGSYIADVELRNTSDAFDGWGRAYVSANSRSDAIELTPNLETCELFLDGNLSNVTGFNLDAEHIKIDCDANEVLNANGGRVAFRVVYTMQGSFLAVNVYSRVESGTPAPFLVSIGGNLGSDSDTKVVETGRASSWNYVITSDTFGGDPILGFRSKTGFNLEEYPGTTWDNSYDDVYLTSQPSITATADWESAFEAQVWLVDYSPNRFAVAEAATADYAAAPFGTCIASIVGSVASYVDQCTGLITRSLQPGMQALQPDMQGGSSSQGNYAGPTINSIDKKIAAAGSVVVLQGTKLDSVTKVTIDGITIAIKSQSANSLTLELPALLTLGFKDLVLTSSYGNLSALAILKITAAQIPESVPSPALKKISVGTFKGYVAMYAKGYQGQRFSALIAGKWVKVDPITKSFQRVIRKTGSNKTINVKIFIDRKLERELRITTK
jgi:surface protein